MSKPKDPAENSPAPDSEMTDEHIEEGISRAFVGAIASYAGCSNWKPDFDYKIDGAIGWPQYEGGQRVFPGISLFYQLKASRVKFSKLRNGQISYALEGSAWNAITAINNMEKVPFPLMLIACWLHDTKHSWVASNHDSTVLQHACYWRYLKGASIGEESTKTIHFTDDDLFCPKSLTEIMKLISTTDYKKNFVDRDP